VRRIVEILERLMDWLFLPRKDMRRRIPAIVITALLASVSFAASGNLQPRKTPVFWIYPPPVRRTIVEIYFKENLFKWFPEERDASEIVACYVLAFSGWILGGVSLFLFFPVLTTGVSEISGLFGLGRDATYFRIRASLRQGGREEGARFGRRLRRLGEELCKQSGLQDLGDPQWEHFVKTARYPDRMLPAMVALIKKHALLSSPDYGISRSAEYAPNMVACSLSLLPLPVRGAAFLVLAELT
jgi:hypothetical protein